MKVKKSTFVFASILILIIGAIVIVSAVQMKVNQNDLFVSGGKVGIGTANPGSKLQVIGDIRSSEGNVATDIFSSVGVGSGYIGTRTNHPLRIRTNDQDKVTIDTNGNVGIGTLTPSEKLDVEGSVRIAGGNSLKFGPVNSGESIVSDQTPHNLIFRTNYLDRMIITNGGSVGIGTANPSQKLDVAGQVKAGRYWDDDDIHFIDSNTESYMNSIRLDEIRLIPRETAPACDQLGKMYVDTSGWLCFCDGSAWLRAVGQIGGNCA